MTYRLLNPGELIMDGDEYLEASKWNLACASIGSKVTSTDIIRRPLGVPDWWLKHPEVAPREEPICATEAQSKQGSKSFTKEQLIARMAGWINSHTWDTMTEYLNMAGAAYLMANHIWEHHEP